MIPRPLATATILLAHLAAASASAQESLPGTRLWENRGDPAKRMVDGLHRFLDRELAASVEHRRAVANLPAATSETFPKSVEPLRRQLEALLGLVEPRVRPVVMELVGTTEVPALIAESDRIRVSSVRWPVLGEVWAEGLLLEPKSGAKAQVVALADCDVSPEQFVGLAPGVPVERQVARLLAEQGCRVVVPTLLDRSDAFSGNPAVRATNLTHREWIWRMAFETGRHPIGYEVESVRAVVDWFTREGIPKQPIGVVGYGEGGLIALYSLACDPRIDRGWVAGYFGQGTTPWNAPVYRDVFGLLNQFGDAEILRLAGPRSVLIEACRGPEIPGPPPSRNGRSEAASGVLATPSLEEVRAEYARAGAQPTATTLSKGELLWCGDGTKNGWNEDYIGLKKFLRMLSISDEISVGGSLSATATVMPTARDRQRRLVRQWQEHTQALLRTSEYRRYALWSRADSSSLTAWTQTVQPLREQLWDEVIGRLPAATEPLEPRSIKLYDTLHYVGYGVEIPVWNDVVASGVLLLPKDLKPGEKRPVVVCQHGLEGRPDEVVDPRIKSVYHSFGSQLADRGYIVYAPQNPYIGVDHFRKLQRKLHPLGKSLFAVIVRQHERTLEWLKTLSNVDPDRIAFYGLSYGGKTAMRVPALLTDYCLSICSADFNEWVVKCTNLDRPMSYLYTIEYDMYEWGLANGFNYAEMAGLIAPRPFMVERGHRDGVAPDEWIGYEYAKVKRLYDTLGIGDRTEIGYFNGPHEIHGVETFRFLARHLDWPRGNTPP